MSALPFAPAVGDDVDTWDVARREWRTCTVELLPPPGQVHYHVIPRDGAPNDRLFPLLAEMRSLASPHASPHVERVLTVTSDGRPVDLVQECERMVVRIAGLEAVTAHMRDDRPVYMRGVQSPRGPSDRAAPWMQLAGALIDLLPAGVRLDPETPHRMFAALAELLDGYQDEPELKMFELEESSDPGVAVVTDIPFASLCEHHVLPFSGHVSVAYLPRGKIVGLSKIPRLVRAISRRLQTQERMGEQIARALEDGTGAGGVMVIVRSHHSCMCHRGIESPGRFVTSCARGVFLDNAPARAEAMALMQMR